MGKMKYTTPKTEQETYETSGIMINTSPGTGEPHYPSLPAPKREPF